MKYMRNLFLVFALFMPALLLAAPVNINTADKQQLLNELDNVTEHQAEALINYRNREGAIVGLFELYNVEGLGRDFISPNHSKMTVGDVNWGDKKGT